MHLWLHPDLNAGGFVAMQIQVWANSADDVTPEGVEAAVDELLAHDVIAVDDHTGELFLRWFIQYDSSRKPNLYINAMRAIQTCRSAALRRVGLEEIERLHPPPLKRNPKTPDETYDSIENQWDEAYRALWARVMKEPFANRSRTVVEQEGEAESEGAGEKHVTFRSQAEPNPAAYGECLKCRQAQCLGPEAEPGEKPIWCGSCNYEEHRRPWPDCQKQEDFGGAS